MAWIKCPLSVCKGDSLQGRVLAPFLGEKTAEGVQALCCGPTAQPVTGPEASGAV